mgnify:CR=1 FL=1
MRISEMETGQVCDLLCEITPYIEGIVKDEELLAELQKSIGGKAETRAELLAFGAQKISKLVPIILKKRKADLFGILGALNNKTQEEIEQQNFIKTMSQIREIVKDKELIDFFKSCAGLEGSV